MTVFPLQAFKDNYIWILLDEASGLFDCVDPGEAKPVIDYAQKTGFSLRAILLTHHHYDHVGGVDDLIQFYPSIKIYGPNDVRVNSVNVPVNGEQPIEIGSNAFQIMDTPGHTSTHISYYEVEKQWLFCGDTLFSAGCGRVFDGTIDELYQSLLLYKNLPDTTAVYCAHEYTTTNLMFALTIEPSNKTAEDYLKKIRHENVSCTLPSTIALEKKINPFFRVNQSEIQKYAEINKVDPNDALAVFSFLRHQKDKF
ncbi:hydroxyacylglutathione hydrolase [Legionella israelensis]|uniref:Hydroxyacylglutathione hydrolase n=1 Tax=Legionella israelensis TaxID=454 RepID=A0A0W0VHB7_9GAMM|nr:hydroxyacylglutathione hydrolase [Legionella israelensis]KTD19491.1 hydroxyacylglutathione hydrolase (glyoxalase II) [Legionella israelensis]QBS08659.1 hydroxyacylglutathione hydrolase [Legionella israelensis]SCY46067.1 hydroxyacylglutathione hydrolase [Legionella israelensis DSM 19235]STX58323.1 hydroxyacylglutathione hydrolase [Legionella israelensis]